MPKTGQHRALVTARPQVMVCPSDSAEPVNDRLRDIPAAVGSYAFVMGNRGVVFHNVGHSTVKFTNNGFFQYVVRRRLVECVDGLSKTMTVGEVVDGHTRQSSNIWTFAARVLDSLRVTDNPLNTWPGEPVYREGGSEVRVNGAFAGRHPQGAHFVFGDGHVQFLSESVHQDVCDALSTRDAALWPYANRPEPLVQDY